MGSCLEHPIGRVEEAQASWSAQKLPGGGRQVIAVEGLHIDRQLSDCLAGIDQVRYAGFPADPADCLDRLHQT
jgi:hypothetical protein